MPSSRRGSRAPYVYCAIALLARTLVCAQVDIPGRDGASYLWMGEQVAAGHFEASFATVFPPFYPWCIAATLTVAPGLDTVRAGQIASILPAAMATLPLWSISSRISDRLGAHLACLCYALGAWFCRHPADCMSEGPFYLLVATVTCILLRTPGIALSLFAGMLVGLAYGTRPEGAALAILGGPWLWLRKRASATAFAAAAALTSLLFPLGYAAFGDGFTLTPKAQFNWQVGAGDDTNGGIAHYLLHLLRMPGHVFESVGYVATALAIVGLYARGREGLRGPSSLPLALFCIQALVAPILRSTIRFYSGYGMLLLAFVADGARYLVAKLRIVDRRSMALLGIFALAPDLVRICTPQREEKAVLRELGAYLRPLMQPEDELATAELRPSDNVHRPSTMCRVEFFAGKQPGPPRTLTIEETRAMFRSPKARFATLGGNVPGLTREDVIAMGFVEHPLPEGMAERAATRRIQVFERPR